MGRLEQAQLLAAEVLQVDVQRGDGPALVRDAERLIRVSHEKGHLQFSLERHDVATRMARGLGLADELAPLREELRQLMVP